MEDLSKKQNDKLPTIRQDLVIAFNDYDIEGKPQWLIHDIGRNKFFLIGWPEFEIYERWILGSKQSIVESINHETTLHIEVIDVDNFIQFLHRNFLLEMSGHEINKQAEEQKLFKTDSLIPWLIHNYLFFRIPLVRPDNFLNKTKIIGNAIFSPITFYIMCFLGIIAIYQINLQWDEFVHTFASIFTFTGLMFSLLAFIVCKCFHELGHAYMCKRYGVPVPTLGIAFLVFWPILYTDTTLSWSLSNRQRLRIALAGIWVETYIAIIAALIWSSTSNQTLQAICYVTISVNWLASVLLNVSPFMRFDGYYVLADYLKMPNLQHRAFALTRWKIRQWLFGWEEPPPEKFSAQLQHFLIIYSLITWIYRLIIYLGIAILVYHFFAKAIGIILFLIEIYYFILAPVFHEFYYWYTMRSNFSLNKRTIISCSTFFILFILFFMPLKHTVKIPATLRYSHEFLIAPEAGILKSPIPPAGTTVKKDQPIVVLESHELQQAILETQLEYQKTVSQLRRADINPEYINQKNILMSDIKRLKAEYDRLINTKRRLTLLSPFNGVLIESDSEITPGTYIMKDQWLGDIIDPTSISIEGFVPQVDVNSIKVGSSGEFYADNLESTKIKVKVQSVELINAKEFDCRYSTKLKNDETESMVIETPCYNASELGGEIATHLTEQGNYVPTASVYRVLLTTSDLANINHVVRGTVYIDSEPKSYAGYYIYNTLTIIIEELGF